MLAKNRIPNDLLNNNPKFTKEQISYIIGRYLGSISIKISKSLTFNLNVPKFGRIHTHGNLVDKSQVKLLQKQYKSRQKKRDMSDKNLLF